MMWAFTHRSMRCISPPWYTLAKSTSKGGGENLITITFLESRLLLSLTSLGKSWSKQAFQEPQKSLISLSKAPSFLLLDTSVNSTELPGWILSFPAKALHYWKAWIMKYQRVSASNGLRMAKITWHFLANPAQQRFVNWNEWRPSFGSAMRLKRMQVVILVRHPMHLGRRTSASMWRFGVCVNSTFAFQEIP